MTDGLRLQLWDDNPSLVDFLGFDAVVAPIVAAISTPDIDPVAVGVHSPGAAASPLCSICLRRS